MIRLGSLYSGIAGLELGILAAFVEAGIPARVAWQCEIDPFATSVLAQHFPDVQRFSDVATVHNPPDVDVLCGGFACQDVSAAGKGAGLGIETRSGFTLHHLLRIIDETRARWLVIENVASGAKRWLPRVVQELRSRGYRPRAVPLGAIDVGAPHRRQRVFVVADRTSGPRGEVGPAVCGGRERDVTRPSGERGTRGPGGRDGAELAHTTNDRREVEGERASGRLPDGERQLRRGPEADRQPQPGMGGDAHGVSYDVAGHPWPAPRGPFQHAWEQPRAFTRDMTDADRAKLRALGNAVVPQCSLVVGRVLIAKMREMTHEQNVT